MGPWNKAGELCVFKKSEESVTDRRILQFSNIIKSLYLLLFFSTCYERLSSRRKFKKVATLDTIADFYNLRFASVAHDNIYYLQVFSWGFKNREIKKMCSSPLTANLQFKVMRMIYVASFLQSVKKSR